MARILEKEVTFLTTNITVLTTTETILATTPKCVIPVETCRTVIRGWCSLVSGAGTTTVTLRIRRGTLVTDPQVGDAINFTIPTAAGGTDMYFYVASEELQGRESVQYTLTVQQAGAGGNGTTNQEMIEVEILNG